LCRTREGGDAEAELTPDERCRQGRGDGIRHAESPIDVALDFAEEEIERAIGLRFDAVQRADIRSVLERCGEVFRWHGENEVRY